MHERAVALGKQATAKVSDPRSAAPLIRLHALKDEVDDLTLLLDPTASLAWRRHSDPGVRAWARALLADIERARGRTVRAEQILSTLGFVQDWYVVGGFDNEGKGGCNTDFGPESGLDLKATYPARAKEVGWRVARDKGADGYVDLSNTLSPSDEVVAYALGFLESDAETRTTLALGTSGGFRLWVNGQKVLVSDTYNQPRLDQARVEVTLRKGTNRVLLKICQSSGPLGFYFRNELDSGAKATVAPKLPETVPPLERGPSPQPKAVPTLVESLQKRVQASPNDAALRADYATVLAWTKDYDERERTPMLEAERAAEVDPSTAELQLIAAAQQVDDDNHRRRYLEKALTLDRGNPWARLELARHELGRDHPERALPIADALVREVPDFAPAWLLKAQALEALDDKVASDTLEEAAFLRFPFVPSVAREAVGQSRRHDRLPEAVDRARMALGLRFDDLNTRRLLASMLADMGRVDEAAEQYRKVLQLDPLDLSTQLRLAELLSANGQLEAAKLLFAGAQQLAPQSPEVFEREGRALLHNGRRDEALSAFEASLTVRPQNPALREVVRTLRGEDQNGATPWALDVAPVMKATAGAKDADAVILADVTAVRVQATGTSSRFSQLAVRVLTQRGVEAFRSLPITWSPDRQEVRVLKTRITRPDGSVIESYSDSDRNMNEPWTGMYYDARARILTFPALAQGDVLEVQWRLDDTAAESLLSDYWGDVDVVQSLFDKKRYRYVVDMPASRKLHFNQGALPAWLTVKESAADGRTVTVFEATDVPRLVPEPNMPGFAEVAAPLHLSTYATWEDVGRYYWGLVQDQLRPDDAMRKQVDVILKNVDRRDQKAVVAAVYDWVVQNTRYVALEFGIHGYKPYRVDRVFARRFGDCKDKASLIHTLLRIAGVDSRLVLLRMRNLGTLKEHPASLSAFNHAIAYVPSLDLYLDGTAEFHGATELPTADRVANVLVVEPEGKSRFLTTPEAEPQDNLSSLTMKVALKPDGSAMSEGLIRTVGQGAPEVRRAYETPATRQATFEQQWAMSFPGLKASSVTVSDVTRLEQPVEVKFAAALPRYAEAGPGWLRFHPFGASRTFTQALAPLATRKLDAVFPGVWQTRFDFTYTPPGGYEPVDLPGELLEDSPFGLLRITTKWTGTLEVTGELTLSRARVEAANYPAFRAWLLKVDQAFGRKLELRKQGGQSARR